jgi:hypothetical protein
MNPDTTAPTMEPLAAAKTVTVGVSMRVVHSYRSSFH